MADTLAEIYAKADWWSARRKRAERRCEVAQRTVESCHQHLGVLPMVEAIADLLQPHFPDHDLRVLGPFGLTNECSIHANDPSVTDRFNTVGSLTFRPAQSNRLYLVDRSRELAQYPVGSLGERNGMNYPEVDMPESIEELVEMLRASIERG